MEGEGGEVVTREPYRKVRLDHLLSRETVIRSEGIWTSPLEPYGRCKPLSRLGRSIRLPGPSPEGGSNPPRTLRAA